MVTSADHRSQVISPGDLWDEVLSEFSKQGKHDIYFDYRYMNMFDSEKCLVRAFLYRDSRDCFFLPYHLLPIDCSRGWYDLETPYGYSGPLSTTDSSVFLSAAWRSFFSYCSENFIVAGLIRCSFSLANHRWLPCDKMKVLTCRPIVYGSLKQTISEILGGYPKSLRNRVSKASRDGLYVSASTAVADVELFSKIYFQRMRALNASEEYFYGPKYFAKLQDLKPESFKIYICKTAADEILGGCLILYGKEVVHYHLSASFESKFKHSPSDFLRHWVYQQHLGGNYRIMNFGGGRTDASSDSLLAYKLKFSRDTHLFRAFGFIANQAEYKKICDLWYMAASDEKRARYDHYFLKYRY